ncbi:bifunctional FO biosynthesis protein CofGH [Streptomyces hirsutus]
MRTTTYGTVSAEREAVARTHNGVWRPSKPPLTLLNS